MALKEIYYDFQIDELEPEKDFVDFVLGEFDEGPKRMRYVGIRNGHELLFKGFMRDGTENEIYKAYNRHHLSPCDGEIKVQDRVTYRSWQCD